MATAAVAEDERVGGRGAARAAMGMREAKAVAMSALKRCAACMPSAEADLRELLEPEGLAGALG